MIVQIVGRPSNQSDRAQPPSSIEVAAGDIAAQSARQIGKDHNRKLETFRLVHGHQPHAAAALFHDRRLGGFRILGGAAELVDEAAKRNAAARLVLARELGDMENVRERLLAARTQNEADMSSRRGKEPGNRIGDRPVVSDAVEFLE